MPALPGSEQFRSRPLDRAELRPLISGRLPLHEVDEQAVGAVDALTYEVIRHRLWSITNEMGETLKRMSGTPVVEVNDFDFTICDELGYEVQVGLYNTGLAGAMDLAIAWTLRNRADNPGIQDGDMFICNDPWIGAGLHQNDVTVLLPVFHEGKLFSWITATLHQVDLGGVSPGSWSVAAKDVFAESLPTPPLKICRDFRLLKDVEDAWVRRSRVPMLCGLDLRAQVGANLMARDRMLEIVDRYGADTVKAVMQRMMDDAERRLRAKLAALPDGTWMTVGYQEQAGSGDRGLHAVRLTMTKQGGHLTFDFRGSDPQAGMINCAYPCLRASVMLNLLPIMAGDIPWAAGGLMRCYDVLSEEGTVVDAAYPAAVAKASTGAMWVAGNLVGELLTRMLDTTPEFRRDVQSICAGTWDGCVVAGLNERGIPFIGPMMDPMAGGFGAKADADGMDTGGVFTIPMGRSPDAEMTEFLVPVLMLWRREEPDSGGPGRQRGGVSGSVCLVPYGLDLPLTAVFTGSGKATTLNRGLAGGYPGNTQLDVIARGAGVLSRLGAGPFPRSLGELGGELEPVECEVETFLAPDDALFLHWQSGGGYGDPLLREPQAVASDVADRLVSAGAAGQIYGVVLAPDGSVDAVATGARRAELRQQRRDTSAPAAAHGAAGHRDARSGKAGTGDAAALRLAVDENLRLRQAGGLVEVACAHCGTGLGDAATFQVDQLPVRDAVPHAVGGLYTAEPGRYIDQKVVFRQYLCPGCYTCIEASVSPVGHPAPAATLVLA
jgi:N-methylhydantoinase B